MKKNILIISFLIFTFFTLQSDSGAVLASFALAQNLNTVTPTITKKPTPVPSEDISPTASELEKIEKIKDLVASKVAELKLVEKRGILGTVKDTATNQITISDLNNNNRIIDVDELTKFQGNDSSSKSFGISDLKSGDLISAVGLYNKDTKRLLARFVYLNKTLPVQLDGTVTDKDKINYTLIVKNSNGETKTVNIETSTKTKSYSKNEGLIKSGFSKINISDKVLVTGFYDLKDKNIIIGDRIIIFSDLFTTPTSAIINPSIIQPTTNLKLNVK